MGGGRVGGGRVGGGKVKGQLSLGAVVTSVVRERMGKATAVQTGRALPTGRCTSPPWSKGGSGIYLNTTMFNICPHMHNVFSLFPNFGGPQKGAGI